MDIIQQKLRYIHRNPVEEGLVEEPHHYLYSSARDEAGLPGMLKLETIWGEVITEPVPSLRDHRDNLGANG